MRRFVKRHAEAFGIVLGYSTLVVVTNVIGYYILKHAVSNGVMLAVVQLQHIASN
jgi:hypothetical protein